MSGRRVFRAYTALAVPLAVLALAACGSAEDTTVADAPEPPSLSEVAETEARARSARAQARADARPLLRREVPNGFLTPEIVHSTALAGTPPRGAALSPNGTRLTYLKGSEADPDQLDLWARSIDAQGGVGEEELLVSSLDLLGAPATLSEEERNRRERAREYGRGIIAYSWIDADTLLFPLGGDVYLFDLPTRTPQQVTATDGFESDVKLSADGRVVAYVRDDELYATELATGLERQLTRGSTETIRNAVASFVVQEELARSTGYWLSPDAERVAFTQIDESPIAVESRIDMGVGGLRTLEQRYPFAGTPNARVRLGVTRLDGRSEPVWADLPGWGSGESDDIYLTRVAWSPDARTLYAGILARDHKTHTIYAVDPRTGTAEAVYAETSPTWINVRTDILPTETGFRLISERDGIRRLYAVDTATATENDAPAAIRPLTPPGLLVNALRCASEDALFIEGWDDDPLQRHIFRIDMPGARDSAPESTQENVGTGPVRISTGEGAWTAGFDADCTRWVGRFSASDQPPQVGLYDARGERLFWLDENRIEDGHPFAPFAANWIAPRHGTLEAVDGRELHYQLYLPPQHRAGERRPSVTLVYGGPGPQRVHKRWERRELANILAHHGFVVFQLDGRGSGNRGKAFEDPLYRNMGGVEVEDQLQGARWLAEQDFIDPARMGVYGWSYGGYLALHMLGQTDAYAAGVAGAPVTDWRLYDTAYTERYLGDPTPGAPNHTEGAYERGAVMSHIDGLTEPVLVIHGMADDNVVFRHTVLFADAMIEAGRNNFTVLPYPGEKHGFRARAARIHRDRASLEFFLDRFGGTGDAPG